MRLFTWAFAGSLMFLFNVFAHLPWVYIWNGVYFGGGMLLCHWLACLIMGAPDRDGESR